MGSKTLLLGGAQPFVERHSWQSEWSVQLVDTDWTKPFPRLHFISDLEGVQS